jgi:hypothetical protein
MIERHDGVRFLLKAFQALGISGKAHGQKFERGLATRCHVGRQIDFTHAADAYRFRNFVVADRLTDYQVSLPISDDSRRNTGS